MNIWWLSDGKAGHAAQARGLWAALQRQGVPVHWVEVPRDDCSVWGLLGYWCSAGRYGRLPAVLAQRAAPDLLLGVGHRSHWPLILLKKIFKTPRTLVLMKPSLPLDWFDLAMIPQHDQPLACDTVLATTGVLNPLSNEQRHQPHRILILIGGASKRHGVDLDALIWQLQQLLDQIGTQHTVVMTTSRRTPTDFVEQPAIQTLAQHIQICPVEHAPQGWLFEQLQLAEVVWVTEDSVSMLYEALTAGCRVGVLAMPRQRHDRITHAVDQMIERGMVGTLPQVLQGQALPIAMPLAEADRAAIWLNTHLGRAE